MDTNPPTTREALDEVIDLLGGLGVLLLPLFPLAIPGAVALGLVLLPLAALTAAAAVAGAILASPYLLFRAVTSRRRASS